MKVATNQHLAIYQLRLVALCLLVFAAVRLVAASQQRGDAVLTGGPFTPSQVGNIAGEGFFMPHPDTPSFGAQNSYDVALGDLDNDGDLDAVVANIADEAETVWINDGNGNFAAHTGTASFGEGESKGIALGDLDGDGDLDAVVANDVNQAETVWLNDGNGNFTDHTSFGAENSYDVALGDLDNDGDLDAVVANMNDQAESVWMNDGNGNFSAHTGTHTFGSGESQGIALGDIDSDGDLDALVANIYNELETVWLNDGAGNFSAHSGTASFNPGSDWSMDIALGDLDGDNDLDAVVATYFNGGEKVWLNDGDGNFTTRPNTPAFGNGNSFEVDLADLDADGDLDAVVANYSSQAETVWLNDGDGNFTAHPSGPSFGAESSRAIAVGDLDGDGDLDALVANANDLAETVWLNYASPGVTVNPTAGLETTEAGSTATFDITLNTAPTATVTIDLSSSDVGEGIVNPTSLSFDATNWDTLQTVTVTGVDDYIVDGNVAYTIITTAASSTDPLYDGIDVDDVSVTNLDDDMANINVTPTNVQLSEGGPSATYEVVLSSQPAATVTITVSSGGQTQVSPATLSFDSGNWNVAQEVTVTAVDDTDIEGAHSDTITHSASSTDPAYGGLGVANVAVSILDNEHTLYLPLLQKWDG